MAKSVERPPHNREVLGSNPGRVIPKDVNRRELLLPCLASNNKGKSNVDLALISGCRAHDQLGKKNFHFRFNLTKFGVDLKDYYYDYYYYDIKLKYENMIMELIKTPTNLCPATYNRN